MRIFVGLAAVVLILLVLLDSFETTVLPRRVTHRFRFARFYYFNSWRLWRAVGLTLPAGRVREAFLGMFGPLSLLGLLAMWVVGLIFSFALIHWSLRSGVTAPESEMTFWSYLYWSGGTFFTLGYGDITPTQTLGRAVAVIEAGMGFGFLALIISYLPVIYQTFSKRESEIALLDARAGSPPSAAQLLIRAGQSGDAAALDPFLAQWELWAAELLESHLSFPVLVFYRSQHDNQSWLSSLTAILDTCAIAIAAIKDRSSFQAQVTFAMSRHAAVDLVLIVKARPLVPDPNRLPLERLQQLFAALREAGYKLHDESVAAARLTELRAMYEPFVNALGRRFLYPLPQIHPEKPGADNWQRSAWMKRAPDLANLSIAEPVDEHFK